MKRWFACALVALGLVSCSRPTATPPVTWTHTPVFDDAFWRWWGDGQAELAGYDLITPRYGELRHGTAVTIVVTETFSEEKRVKADPGRHGKTDEFPVMKLNLIQDFATGVYDYNLMTSAFVALTSRHQRAPGSATKVSFSAQEWCGHAYAQLLFDTRYARFTGHSYFDGEADSTSGVPVPSDAIAEDALLLWARGFVTPVLAPGLGDRAAHGFAASGATDASAAPPDTGASDAFDGRDVDHRARGHVRMRRAQRAGRGWTPVDVLGRGRGAASHRAVDVQRWRAGSTARQRSHGVLAHERARRRGRARATRAHTTRAPHAVSFDPNGNRTPRPRSSATGASDFRSDASLLRDREALRDRATRHAQTDEVQTRIECIRTCAFHSSV
jgi:hypothetical protein